MDIVSTILVTLVITLLSMVLLVPVAWRGAKFFSNIVESVAPGYGEVARLLIVIGTACFILYNRFKDLRNRGI